MLRKEGLVIEEAVSEQRYGSHSQQQDQLYELVDMHDIELLLSVDVGVQEVEHHQGKEEKALDQRLQHVQHHQQREEPQLAGALFNGPVEVEVAEEVRQCAVRPEEGRHQIITLAYAKEDYHL